MKKEIWNWTAYLWDCLEVMDELIAQGIKVDAIITDPPYWTTACKWDTIIPFESMWERLNKLIKPNGAIVLFWSEPFSSALRMSNIKNFRYDIIWEKERPTNIFFVKKQIAKVHEIVSIFYKKQPTYNPQMEKSMWVNRKIYDWNESKTHLRQKYQSSEEYDSTIRFPRSVLKINRDIKAKEFRHPTQKPVALIEYLIKTYTNEWELVLDFTAWSFTTALACENTNRKWICIEKEENYFNIWIERINNNKNLWNK